MRAAYDRLIAEWLAGGRMPLQERSDRRTRGGRQQAPAAAGQQHQEAAEADQGPTVAELVLAFLRHAETYYRRKDGSLTGAADNSKDSLRPLTRLYPTLPARRFRPRHLKAVRELMVTGYFHPKLGQMKACCRSTVNARVARIVAVWRWAVEEEKVPERVWLRLSAVRALEKGRSAAREGRKVRPVAPGIAEKTLPYLRPPAAGLLRFQLHTGCRPTEAILARLAHFDRSGDVWVYRPRRHKTEHEDKERVVAVGPKAQAVVLEFVRVRWPRG